MTSRQSSGLYFPAWTAALKANWTVDRGTAVLTNNPPGGDRARQVDAIATERATKLARSVKADDLRHACHMVALGRDKSSKEMTNADLDKVLNLFRVLQDEYNLAASAGISHPDQDVRRRLEWAVNNCGLPTAYIAAIARATQGSSDWKSFDNRALGLLVATLRSRARARSEASLAPRKLPRTYAINRRTEHQPI